MTVMVLFPLLLIGTAICAFGRRWWWIAFGLGLCFAVRIIAPPPPADTMDFGKGGEATPRHIVVPVEQPPPPPPIVIKPYKDPDADR